MAKKNKSEIALEVAEILTAKPSDPCPCGGDHAADAHDLAQEPMGGGGVSFLDFEAAREKR